MIYDHERDAESRRGRQVADWGGDDLFSSMPRRRSKHTGARPRRISGPVTGAHAVRRGEGAEFRPVAESEAQASADASLAELVRRGSDARLGIADAGGAVALVSPPDPASSQPVDAAPATASERFDVPERRTVTVTGRPESLPLTRERRRPQATLQERLLSDRPDKIAGWAFGLGITLILIALGTADGGVI
jgi:hypothetical protein